MREVRGLTTYDLCIQTSIGRASNCDFMFDLVRSRIGFVSHFILAILSPSNVILSHAWKYLTILPDVTSGKNCVKCICCRDQTSDNYKKFWWSQKCKNIKNFIAKCATLVCLRSNVDICIRKALETIFKAPRKDIFARKGVVKPITWLKCTFIYFRAHTLCRTVSLSHSWETNKHFDACKTITSLIECVSKVFIESSVECGCD